MKEKSGVRQIYGMREEDQDFVKTNLKLATILTTDTQQLDTGHWTTGQPTDQTTNRPTDQMNPSNQKASTVSQVRNTQTASKFSRGSKC